MQIVIEISEEDYKNVSRIVDMGLGTNVDEAIKNGTPLPKGHGRLIDADELYNSLEFPTQQFASAFKQVLDDAPTIIEAEEEKQ